FTSPNRPGAVMRQLGFEPIGIFARRRRRKRYVDPACTATPLRVSPSWPAREGSTAAFRHTNTLGTQNASFSGLTSHGPSARAPTHRRARRRPASALSPSRSSQGSLPTCLAALVGRDSHPLDDSSAFLEAIRSLLPYGPGCLVALVSDPASAR